MKISRVKKLLLMPVSVVLVLVLGIVLWHFEAFAADNIKRLSEYRHAVKAALVKERLKQAGNVEQAANMLDEIAEQFRVSYLLFAEDDVRVIAHHPDLSQQDAQLIEATQALGRGYSGTVAVADLVSSARLIPQEYVPADIVQLVDVSKFYEQKQVMRRNLLLLTLVAVLAVLAFYILYARRLTRHMAVTQARLNDEIAQHNAAKDALIAQQEERLHLAENDLMVSRRRYHTLFDRTADALMMLRAGQFSEANAACLELFECATSAEFLGMHPSQLSPEFQEGGVPSRTKADEMIAIAFEKGSHRFEWLHQTRKGRVFPAEVLLTVIDDGDEPAICAIVRDITQRKNAEQEIKYQAYYDSLTGLPNRRLMLDRISQILASSKRHQYYNALLFVDLDRFKFINDSLGHSVGDELLMLIAKGLQKCVRDEDTVARFGGDEFVLLLSHLHEDQNEASMRAERQAEVVHREISRTYQVKGHGIHVTASIGIYLFPEADESLDDIIKQADTAMYSAKDSGRNRIAFFQSTMQDAVVKRLTLEKDLREAVQAQQLKVHYQPQIGRDQRVHGVEALVRWQHPELGFIRPDEFISIAEDSGIIYDLGDYVLRQAIKHVLQLPVQPSHLSVNISPYQFRHPDFVRQIKDVVTHYRLKEGFLVLEITEGVVIDSLEETRNTLKELRNAGVGVSLDDFGTGYSSLSYLKRLPIDELKIDRSFVAGIERDAHDAQLVETIINMAHQFNLITVAEGVETEAQRDFLEAAGCRVYQGYFYSKPVPIETLRVFLAEFPTQYQQA
ncbi:MAG: EAL domain-containing protein [Oleiphilaceae bacterium]|nr:EAL domain-containing protein [Oleiphilaceae bacterium]